MRMRQRTLRLRVIAAVLGLLALGLLVRSYHLQVLQAAAHAAAAESQYVRYTADLYNRGSIYFTTKDGVQLSAAAIQGGYVLAVDPSRVTNAVQLCSSLETIVAVAHEVCVNRATLPSRTYVELDDAISEETAEQIDALDAEGLFLTPHQWRYYPGGSVAARVVGFVGYSGDNPELRGRFGLERQYDDVLYREQDARRVNFFAELFTDLGSYVINEKNFQSGDLVTTLEPSVSRMLDTVLQDTHDRFDSRLTGAIIMRPDTGEIVAMNALPGFDINNRATATIEQFGNPLVEDVYEFGSTIKALTVAAGLDSGVITSNSTYYDSGALNLDGFTIRNFDGRARGTVPIQEILSQSLNTGVAHIVTLMGKDLFRDYFMSFRLGSETGIDLPNEAFGLVDNLNASTDVEYATASFGQGIALTPMAATRALATLANGGKLVTPHVTKEIRYTDGTVKEIRYPDGAQVLTPATTEEVSRMLSVVVDDALRGGGVALPNHTVGAKTGTAQIPDPVNGGYFDDKFLHSFFGYFPAYDPEFIIFLYTVEPEGVRYASETLTDPFMSLTEFLINYYSIPPDR